MARHCAWVALVFLAACVRVQPADVVLTVEDFEGAWAEGRWAFSPGQEFPGAKGSFGRAREAARNGRWGGRLAFDFTGGGNYVAAILRLDDAPDVAAVRLLVRQPRGNRLTFRYTDQTGQTLQRGFLAREGEWAEAFIPMAAWTGHWGGANDGVVHGPPKQVAFLVANTGAPQGELWFDDVRLIPGKPGKGAGMVTTDIVAARFSPDEGWRSRATGPSGTTRLDGRSWRLDFSQGAAAIGIVPPDASLLGLPFEFRIRARGRAPGHPVRLQLATHFMTFERTIGEFDGGGESELVAPAPPGEGWRWFGGENDGKLHGPLRIRGVFLDAAGKKDVAELELLEVRVKTACEPNRCCVLVAEKRETGQGGEFVATARALLPEPARGTMSHTIRDWAGNIIARGKRSVRLPANGAPFEAAVPVPGGNHVFLEAEFALDVPGQLVPVAQAYHVAPIEPHGSSEPDPASPFGMGIYLYRYGGHPEGLAEMARAAKMAQDAGVKWSREEFHWARIEPQRGKLDWSFYDALVATATRHGISIYGLMAYWSPWTKPYTPEGIEDYCRFAAAAADRYRDTIQHWEVWNEPNIFFWQGPRDMYAELLKKAYEAIKKANPNALVLGCSTAGIDTKFIQRTMELGAPFDILTIHPYRAKLDDRAFIAELQRTAELVKRPVWITEMGWATYVPHNAIAQGFHPNSPREQAKLLARSYIAAIASGAAPNISWYNFRNDGTDPFYFEHNMGILTRDFRPKPAYRAFATVVQVLRGKRVEKPLDLGPNILAYRFAGPDGREPVVALWSLGADAVAHLPADGPVMVVDLMGGRSAVAPAAGKATIPLQQETPVFVISP